MIWAPNDMATLEMRQGTALPAQERVSYRGWRNMYGMYATKNIIPPAAAAELAEMKKKKKGPQNFIKEYRS